MTDTEFFNDPIRVTCSIDEQGQTNIQSLSWRDKPYTILVVGRQWDDADGRHVMAETADSTRFELLLPRNDLIWRVKRAWRPQILA